MAVVVVVPVARPLPPLVQLWRSLPAPFPRPLRAASPAGSVAPGCFAPRSPPSLPPLAGPPDSGLVAAVAAPCVSLRDTVTALAAALSPVPGARSRHQAAVPGLGAAVSAGQPPEDIAPWEGVAFLFFLSSLRVSGRGLCWQMSCKAQLSVSVQRYRSQAQTDQVGGGEPVFLSFLASEVLKSAKNTVVLHIYSVGKCCHTFGHVFAERLTG